MPVDHLIRQDASKPIQEARLIHVLNFHSYVTLTNMRLKTLIDANNSPFARLLLVKFESLS